MRQVLSDITVLELSREPAGAYCGKVFADLGADVVKVEPVDGDPLRRRPGTFAHLNTNKRSIVGGTGTADRARLDALLERADVVIETLGAGDVGDVGDVTTSRDALLARRPELVVATISGFGAVGPYADYRWSDLVAQAAGWALLPQQLVVGTDPLKLPSIAGLCCVGHTAALGALAAVLRSRASGAGAHIDCAAYEALAAVPSRIGRFLGWEYRGKEDIPPMVMGSGATLIPTGVFPCGDGYVSMMSTPQQLGEMLDVLDDDALREAFARPDAFVRPETKEILDAALYPWLLSHTRAELTVAAQAAGWPFAGLYSPAEVLEAGHLHQRGFWVETEGPDGGRLQLTGHPYVFGEGGWRLRRPAPELAQDVEAVDRDLATPRAPSAGAAEATDPGAPPLRGIRVLDFTTVWSGPFATQLLADLGAEVIRVESPHVFPPTTKGYVPRPTQAMILTGNPCAPAADGVVDRPYNRHALNNSVARNKLSCTLDPRDPESRELLMRLVDQSDVFIENQKASTLHRMGIHESELRDRNPNLIVVRIPPAGLTGDWAHYTGFGGQFDGLTGFAYVTGHRDTELVQTPTTTYMDAVTGPAASFAILAALHYRQATGRGQIIELAQMENVLNHLGDVYAEMQLGLEPERLGNRDRHVAQGLYPCRGERFLAITVADDDMWVALAGAIGRPELTADTRFATDAARLANHDDLDAVIAEWALDQDAIDAFHHLQGAGVAAAPLFDDEMLANDPNVQARRYVRPVTSTDVGSYLHIGQAFQGLPQVWDRGSPVLGEDNEYVYKKVLGLDDATYDQLVARSIITNDYLDKDGQPV